MEKDWKGLIFSKIYYQVLLLFYKRIYSPNVYFTAYLKGVTLSKKCTFIGRTYFYRRPNSFISIGSNCSFNSIYNSNLIGIKQPCILSTLVPDAIISVGKYCGFSGTVIGSFTNITLEDNVRCGANTLITDGDWHQDDPRSGVPSPILIKKNVWLGEGVKVLKGVTIGENSVIGAGSIVTKSIPDNVVAAGNPCKVIKQLIDNHIII